MRCATWLSALGLCAMTAEAGCKPFTDHKLARMIYQSRYRAYEECDAFQDRRAMRRPPFDTVPRDAEIGTGAFTTGLDSAGYVSTVPIPVTPELLAEGQKRFDVYCAPCHGVRGDGRSRVAVNMDLRRPPPLVGPEVAGLAPGRVYQAVTEGYGLMRSYVEDLPTAKSRWSVVAYLQALALAYGTPKGALPADLRRRVEEAAP